MFQVCKIIFEDLKSSKSTLKTSSLGRCKVFEVNFEDFKFSKSTLKTSSLGCCKVFKANFANLKSQRLPEVFTIDFEDLLMRVQEVKLENFKFSKSTLRTSSLLQDVNSEDFESWKSWVLHTPSQKAKKKQTQILFEAKGRLADGDWSLLADSHPLQTPIACKLP